MKSISKAVFAAALACGIAAGAPQAFAQPSQAATQSAHAWKHHGPSQRLARLKAQLQITGRQEAAWAAYVNAITSTRPQSAHGRHGERHQPGPLKPAPQVLEARAQRMAEWAQRAQAHASAMKTLYAKLTPAQRAIIDTHLADMTHHFRGHFHRVRGHFHRG